MDCPIHINRIIPFVNSSLSGLTDFYRNYCHIFQGEWLHDDVSDQGLLWSFQSTEY